MGKSFLVLLLAAVLASCASDRRTVGTQVDDAAIEMQARAFVTGNDEIKKKAHIIVTSVNGIVLLTGEAESTEARDRVLAELRMLTNVRRIVNEIRIAAPSSIGNRSQDTWITTKVKSKLLGASDLKFSRLQVLTTNRSVYLLGLVTKEEADMASETARTVAGVERVVRLFELVE